MRGKKIRMGDSSQNKNQGKVWLVGAGPGAPDLITKRGCELLRLADVVVYDALILPETLEMIPETAERIYVGKRAGAHFVPQEEIQRILIREAKSGKRVVRLKGGDPFVFGRGGEEALALARQGIDCEVVPGITSAVAVPEAFGIPVTHRGIAESFTVVTGHRQTESRPVPEKQGAGADASGGMDYEALVRTGGTLVFLMGLGAAEEICRKLTESGMDPDMPAAAISKGTTGEERMVLSTVRHLPAEIRQAGLEAPAILVVGKVCTFANITAEEKKKTTVVITRQKEKAQAFADRIRDAGMEALVLPAIRIRMLRAEEMEPDMIREICNLCVAEGTNWIAFTSENGVRAFFELLKQAGIDLRELCTGGGRRFAAVGPKTAQALWERGLRADLIPETHTGEALGEALGKVLEVSDPGQADARARELGEQKTNRQRMAQTVWYFGAKQTDEGLKQALAGHGVGLKTIPVYETVPAIGPADGEKLDRLLSDGQFRVIFTFTSASCVKNLAAAMPEADILKGQTAVCIGEKTAKAAAACGMNAEMAADATVEQMFRKVCEAADALCRSEEPV